MKAAIIQPPYSTDYSLSDVYSEWIMNSMDRCDETMDIIVYPEACDVPCLAKNRENFLESYKKYSYIMLKKARETAKRCQALLFINLTSEIENGYRNTTYAIGKDGEIKGCYYKQHLTPDEVNKRKIDSDYTFEFSEPTVLEIEGMRFGFLTCYDAYFYEAFANMARKKLDIIIGCSHQRSDTHDALEIMTRFCAYQCNAYFLRSSVSMGETSDVGGASMVVAPDGKVLLNMKSKVGMETVEFDPSKKYYKSAGFGNPPAAHYNYVEAGRRPWKYRPAGSAIVKPDDKMPYPRICAHRGFNTVAPENSMPAFASAIALGAQEIEFDLWPTKDGEIVSVHDSTMESVSDGLGQVYDQTYEELKRYDFGSKHIGNYHGLKIVRFEEILQKFACHVIMNIHIKTRSDAEVYDEDILKKIIALIDKYDCKKYVYFVSGNDTFLQQAARLAPDVCRCVGAGSRPWEIVERAIRYDCKKVQFFKPNFDKEMIDRAHAHGIVCNVFWSDDVEEAKQFLDMGIDTILTNDYLKISGILKPEEPIWWLHRIEKPGKHEEL